MKHCGSTGFGIRVVRRGVAVRDVEPLQPRAPAPAVRCVLDMQAGGAVAVVDDELAASGLAPEPGLLKAAWQDHVGSTFAEATLKAPEKSFVQKGGRRGVHSEHLGYILAEMQFLQRAYPGASW